MANQIINVIVNSKGAVTVRRELEAMGNSARQTTTYLNGLRAVLAAALTFSGASRILEAADSFTVLTNRLRQVADETNTVSQSWQRLLGIANESYATIDSTVNLYFRVAQAYKAWGESADEAYEFVDLFQKAATLSGSSMQTTSQAVYQFGQALNKGKLDGDEFRSVLEGLPYVATLIQKELGVTRGELYELSKDGKISLDRIKDAFENAAETIRSDWGNITPTIGMALNVLSNSWMEFIGEVQTSTGVFSAIAQLILLVANNFDLLAIAMIPVVVSFGFLAGRLGIGLVVIGLRDLTVALRTATVTQWLFNASVYANPYVLAAVAIAALIAAVVYFRNELGLTNEFLSKMWETAVSFFNGLLKFFQPVISFLGQVIKLWADWSVHFQLIRALASVTKQDILSMFKAISEAVVATADYIIKALGPVFTDIIKLAKNFYDLTMEIVDLYVGLYTPAIEAVLPVFKEFWNYARPALVMLIQLVNDITTGWKNLANWFKSNFWPIVRDVFEGWIVIIRKVIDFINDLISMLKTALALMKKVGSGGKGGGGGAHYGAQFKAGEGFAAGGAFKVGGTGAGRDTTPVAFRAERGERVTVETKKQQRQGDQSPDINVKVPLNITNVFDPSMVPIANESAAGQRSIINALAMNRDEVNYILGAA